MHADNRENYKKAVNEKQLKENDLLFSSLEFSDFNSDKCDYLYGHLSNKISMIFGARNNELLAPFSAPFSFIRYGSKYIKYEMIFNFFESLKQELETSELNRIKITLPPTIYNENVLAKVSISLESLGYKLAYRDINSHFDVNSFSYDELNSSAKKAIRGSNKNNNNFMLANTLEEKKKAYEIIAENRKAKGYPLRMTWEQVISTTQNVAKADFFITKTNDEYSSAALVFHVTEDIVQVIYWGATEYGEKSKVMYYLPFKLIEYYKARGVKYIDVGPSSEQGLVKPSLNDYKQMIGCINTTKETWVYNND